jgi:hypothetical protein
MAFDMRFARNTLDRLKGFRRNRKGAIAVEMAFVLPIFISLGFLSWDAATIFTQIKRGTKHYYSFGDTVAAQTDDLSCNRLDKIADLVYASYAAGNWARRPRPSGNDFTKDGALDFRFQLRVVTVQDPALETVTGPLKGRVRWVYFRTPEDMDNSSEIKPGDLIDIPDGLRVAGQTYAQIDGRLWVAPAINYLGVFDFDPANSAVTHKEIDIERFFPLRYVTYVGLDETTADPLSDKCSDGSNYP